MNVCLIGNSLTNLVLAKILANKNIKATIFYEPNRKNKFSIIIINFFDRIKFIPVKKTVVETNIDINPIDWKNISAIKLPLKPNTFLISVFSGKIKFGSSGE